MTAGSAMNAAAASNVPRQFLLEQYILKQGTQAARVHEYLQNGLLPALKRAGVTNVICLDALVAPQMPQIVMITAFNTPVQMMEAHAKVHGDSDFLKALATLEDHAEAPYEQMSRTLLDPTPYTPELVLDKEPRKTPRVYELRVYHSPTFRQLKALHERFAGPEIQIFHRSGVNPILYASTVLGSNMPNLTYLTPFDSLGDREKAWAKFGADPEWIKVRKESIDKHGQISATQQITLYRATAYSPIG